MLLSYSSRVLLPIILLVEVSYQCEGSKLLVAILSEYYYYLHVRCTLVIEKIAAWGGKWGKPGHQVEKLAKVERTHQVENRDGASTTSSALLHQVQAGRQAVSNAAAEMASPTSESSRFWGFAGQGYALAPQSGIRAVRPIRQKAMPCIGR